MTLKEERIINKIWGGNTLNYFNWIGEVHISKQITGQKLKRQKTKVKRSEILKI
ncbi:hypothetical protein ACHOLT_19170 [Desulfitobacterium sp. Sab5]|uniref:hypothetical protein n=1 Tax=Desulfitobacterium nosdiversum TaxID=3375356 RepID=UPI003CF59F09